MPGAWSAAHECVMSDAAILGLRPTTFHTDRSSTMPRQFGCGVTHPRIMTVSALTSSRMAQPVARVNSSHPFRNVAAGPEVRLCAAC